MLNRAQEQSPNGFYQSLEKVMVSTVSCIGLFKRRYATSVRNNGRTSDIYRPNETFVRPFVLSPDIVFSGIASGVEFCMTNPHPHTFLCYVNTRCFQSSRTKQMRTDTHLRSIVSGGIACTRVRCQIPYLRATYTRWGFKGCMRNQCSGHSHTPR